jgi:hypothetical protein
MNNINQYGAMPPEDQQWMMGKTMGVIECVRVALQMLTMQTLPLTTITKLQKLINDWQTGKKTDFVYPVTDQDILKMLE